MTHEQLLRQLRAERDRALAELRKLVDGARSQDGRLTAPEQRQYDEAKARLEQLNERIKDLEEEDRGLTGAGRAALRYEDRANSGVYPRGGQQSYFRDLVMAQLRGDRGAWERIGQHKAEVERQLETRDIGRVDGAGGEFVPPLWLMDEYAEAARAGRVFADRMRLVPLPPGTDSINIPRITGGAATGVQTADNAAVTEVDPVTATVPAPVRTIAGQVDVALQLLDQSPIAFDQVMFADLLADYGAQLDAQVISGSGAAGQLLGVRNTTGILTVPYTDASPTVAEIYPKIADAISQMATARRLAPSAIAMAPRRWAWFLAALDSQQRPLVVPQGDGPVNAAGIGLGLAGDGPVGRLHGLPVYVDGNIPTNLGAGTNEDVVFLVRGEDHMLFESDVRTRVLPEVGSGTLTVRLQLYAYAAFTAARFPASTAIITGTGLVPPTF